MRRRMSRGRRRFSKRRGSTRRMRRGRRLRPLRVGYRM